MKKTLVLVLGLSLAAGPVLAQPQPMDTAAKPAPGSSGLDRTLAIGTGVVAGVLLADLLMGGAIVRPLLGLSEAAAATGSKLYTPAQVGEYRAAGAVIGEGITAATEARDVPARADLLRSVVLVLGGVAGWLGVSHLVED